jgi:hypothetical protein
MSHHSTRLTPTQLHRKRTVNEAEWTNIMSECNNKSIVDVQKCYPHYSYDQIRKRYKKYEDGDSLAVTDRRSQHHRIFSEEQENILAARIRLHRDTFNIHYNMNTIRMKCIEYFHELHPNTRQNYRTFSDGFIKGFKCRHNFSTKKLKCKRIVSNKNEWEQTMEAAQYYYDVNMAIETYGKDFVMNMDETAILFNNSPKTSWGDKGDDKKNIIYTNKSEKDSYSLLPTITASGKQLNLGWINKGKTDIAINKMSLPKGIISYTSPSGWTNEHVMCKYINDIIIPYTKKRECALIVDSYGAHFTDKVKQLANDNSIQLIMVPKGQTATLQPLDISFNSHMKQYCQNLYLEGLRNGIPQIDERQNVIIRAFNSCNLVSENIILNGWKFISI